MISPFDRRYGSEDIRRLFTPQNIVDAHAEAEKALVCVLEELGIAERVSGVKIAAEEVYALEKKPQNTTCWH